MILALVGNTHRWTMTDYQWKEVVVRATNDYPLKNDREAVLFQLARDSQVKK